MSLSAIVKALFASGATPDMIVAAVEAYEAQPKRSKGAERQARYEERKRQKASESVRMTSDDAPSELTSEASESVRNDAQPHARVRDNITNSEIISNLTTLETRDERDPVFDLDWPEGDKPSRSYLDQLETALLEAAGPALASQAIAPNLRILAPILALGRAGKGERCDLQADVFPVIRARAAKAKPGSIRSWDFFTEGIREARDRRLSGAPVVNVHQGPTHDRPPQPSAKLQARNANYERALAGSRIAAQLRAERPDGG